jgi:hypothetical protein
MASKLGSPITLLPHHRQQCPHTFRIKSSPDQQAPAILQPDLNP